MKSQTVRVEPAGTESEAATPPAEGRELALRQERTLRLVQSGPEDLVEIRAASGVVELRVRLTPEGPVLQMESVRLSLKAREAIDLTAPCVAVNAGESLDLNSGGGLRVSGEADVRVNANGEVFVTGTLIHLN